MASETQSVTHKEWVVKIDRDAERQVIKVWVEHSETDWRMDLPNPAGVYRDFKHQFFTQTLEGITTQWLWYRCNRTDRHFLNLETGAHYGTSELDPNSFCWDELSLNDEGTVVGVAGYEWCEPHEIRFFDFSNLAAGCPQIEFEAHPDYELGLDDDATYYWCYDTFRFVRELAWSSLHHKLYDDLNNEEVEALHQTENPFMTKRAYALVLAYDGTRMMYERIDAEPFYAELVSRSSRP
jgi:hypothetical protein